MLDVGAEVGAGLHEVRHPVADGPQVGHDVRAVTDQAQEGRLVAPPLDVSLGPVADAVQRIRAAGHEQWAQQPRERHDEQECDHEVADVAHRADRERRSIGLPGSERSGEHSGAGVVLGRQPDGDGGRQRDGDEHHRPELGKREQRRPHRPRGHVLDFGAVGRAGVLPAETVATLPGRHLLAVLERRGVAQPGAVADGDVQAEHGALAHVSSRADRHPAGPDPSGLRVVPVEEHVPADNRSRTDGQQVGDQWHPPGDDQCPTADIGAESAEEHVVDRGARREGDWADAQERPDHPQPEVGQAPDPDLGLPPASDQDPLGQDRDSAGEPERESSREHTAHIGRGRAIGRHDPLTHRDGEQHCHRGVAEDEDELEQPARPVRRGAGAKWRPLDGCGDAADRPGRGGGCRLRSRQRLRKSLERRVLVDVLHRDRREVRLLANAGTEPRQGHRVGAEVVEEVRVLRNRFSLDHLGEEFREAVAQGCR